MASLLSRYFVDKSEDVHLLFNYGGSVSRRLRTLKRKKEEKENSKNQVSATFLLIFQCAFLRIFYSIADSGCLSRIPGCLSWIRTHFSIPDPGSRVKKIADPHKRI